MAPSTLCHFQAMPSISSYSARPARQRDRKTPVFSHCRKYLCTELALPNRSLGSDFHWHPVLSTKTIPSNTRRSAIGFRPPPGFLRNALSGSRSRLGMKGTTGVHGIVKQHDGSITVDSEPDRGSTFTVYFPQITGRPETASAGDDWLPTGSERILFVDDEEALVEMGEDILAELGYKVTTQMSSTEALSLFRADPSRFDLVITDQTMPQMTGVELAKELLALKPGFPVILCTGFSHLVDADKANAVGIRAFAMKPLTKREIAKTIRKVLDD